MGEADAEGWTDLHLHPVAADWRPAPDAIPELLTALGIVSVGHAVLHAVPDHWDAGDEPPPPAEVEAPPLGGLAALAARADCAVLHLLCDPHACGWGELVGALHSPRDPWRPCVLSVGVGETTIPDARLERTAARFAFSLAIGGPGLPKKPDTAAKTIPASDLVAAAVERLAAVTGTPCAAHLAYGEGW